MQGTENGICCVQSSIGVGFFPSPVHCTYLSHDEGGGGGVKRTIQGSSTGPFNPITTTTYPALWPTHSCTMGTGSLSQG